jgi:hypothetical protein
MRSFSFLILFSFCLLNLRSQDCAIAYEYQSAKMLSKAKVKEIKIQQGNDSVKKILYHYFISPSGCAEKFLHYDLYSKGTEPIQTTYSISAGGKRKIFSRGRITANGFKEYETVNESYSSSGKLMGRVKSEITEMEVITINRYDTSDYNKIAMVMCRKMYQGDTLSMVATTFDHTTRIYILKTKLARGWEESDKIITLFRDNEIYEEKIYKKGLLVKTTTREELSAQKNIIVSADGSSANPLPFVGNPKPDSSYTDNERFAFGTLTSLKKSYKFLVIRYPMLNDIKKTDHYDVFEQKSGLLKKRLFFYSTQSLYFEYSH